MNIDILCKGIEANICHLKKRPRSHVNVESFQQHLTQWLNHHLNGASHYSWHIEHTIDSRVEGDKIDIYGENQNGNGPKWIIEIDATRADQVAQKMLSRFALWGMTKGEPIIYVAILYADTQQGRKPSKKYIRYGDALLKRINSKSRVFGIILGKECPNKKEYVDDDYIEIIDPRANNRFQIGSSTITGMPSCAKKAIQDIISNKSKLTYNQLATVFGNYISNKPGGSRYKSTGSSLGGNVVHTYSQFRRYSNWPPFVDICKKRGISIVELDCWFTKSGIQHSNAPIHY